MIIDAADQKNELVFLPTQQRTSAGESFDMGDDVWDLSSNGGKRSRFVFSEHRGTASDTLIESWKTVAAEMVSNASVSYASRCNNELSKLLHFISRRKNHVEEIDVSHVSQYLEDGDISKMQASLRSILRMWGGLELPGVSPDAIDYVENFSFGNSGGTYLDVLTLDPDRGPYIDTENQMIDESLFSAYQTGKIRNSHFCIIMLFRLYGQRNQQVADLKIRNLRLPRYHNVDRATIEFPFAKQRNGAPSLAPNRSMPKALEAAMEEQMAYVVEGFPISDWNRQPLFPSAQQEQERTSNGARQRERTDHDFKGHLNSDRVGYAYKTNMDALGLRSPRTGQPMKFSTRRERHTVATHLAIRGINANQIASTLQHSDATSCEAYVNLGILHHQLMHSKLDGEFTDFAARFFGEVIESEGLDLFPDSALIDFADAEGVEDVGGCSSGGCSAMETGAAPFACFSCDRFRLLADAPLDDLFRLVVQRYEFARKDNNTQVMSTVARHIHSIAAAKRRILDYQNAVGEISQ
ncbi:hypothetical protein [Palleronia sp.]|uniref:hypothetical protein n=1 Tax=Palleronia sp. TaxID=1940284 RepID=UPI0035C793FB